MLVSYPITPITYRVQDRRIGDTRVGQMAHYAGLQHLPLGFGGPAITITVRVFLHALEADALGPQLTGPGFTMYTVQLTAENRCVVDAATGEILAIRQQESEAEWQQLLDGFGEREVMLQGNFFERLAEHAPLQFNAMIRQHIQQADAMGRFA